MPNEVMEMPNQALGLRKPDAIIEEAKERANALKKIVKETHTSIDIGGKEHLMFEAWSTIGSFYGCTAGCDEAIPVEIDGVRGFKAHARVIHERTGQVVSEAIAYCMRDEDNWEEKPTFQLASMAQTRAMSKAHASKFRSVVVLAGYQGTPGEEMDGVRPAYGPYKLKSGKYAGKLITEVPADFLEWASREAKAPLNRIATEELERRTAEPRREDGANLELPRDSTQGPSNMAQAPAPSSYDDTEAWQQTCRELSKQFPKAWAKVVKEHNVSNPLTLERGKREEFVKAVKASV